MSKSTLTQDEQKHLRLFKVQTEKGERGQVEELFMRCNSPFQFAKTHSEYIKDWEKTKKHMENNLQNKTFPPGVSEYLYTEIIRISDEIIQRKLELVRMLFENKFKESIYNYLGPDGKTKKIFGLF